MDAIRIVLLCAVGLTASCADDTAEGLGQENSGATATETTTVVDEPDRLESRPDRSVAQASVTLHQFDDAVNGLSFPDESLLLAVALNREVLLIDAVTAKEATRFVPCQSCSTVHITRSGDGLEILMPGRARNSGVAYETATGRKLRDLTGPDHRAAWSPDRTQRLSVLNRQAVIEDTSSAHIAWESGITKVGAVGYAPDGSRFVVSADGVNNQRSGGSVLIYDATTRQPDTRIDYALGAFNHVAFSPDSKRLILGSYKSRVLVWDIERSVAHCRFDSDNAGNGLRTLEVSPDGRLIATGGGTDQWGYARVWDVESCTLRAEINLRERVGSLSFHTTEPLLAVGSWSGEVAIVEL